MRSTVLPAVGEAVLAAGWHDDELARGECRVRLIDPHFGLPFEHAQDFLDRVQMRGRAVARVAPLLEHAKLRGAVARRDVHLRHDARPPFFLRLTIEIDDLHGVPRLGCLCKRSG